MRTASVCLQTLLAGLTHALPTESLALSGITGDSRQIEPGQLFLALPGQKYHGLDFQKSVQAAGAGAIAWEWDEQRQPLMDHDSSHCPLIAVEQLRQKIGLIADRFYAYPSQDLNLIGITGTDGKTSSAHFIAQSLDQVEQPCGILGTLGHGVYGKLQNHGLTTADAVSLRRWLAQVRSANGRFAVMEVSSHALAQQRTQGLDFTVAVLTNLTRDHLDYHGSRENYAAAKKQLFFSYQPRHIILNLNDEFGQRWAQQLGHAVLYGFPENAVNTAADRLFVLADRLELSTAGLTMQVNTSWGKGRLQSRLLGRFNASNLLATLAVLLVLDIPFQEALERLSQISTAPGRMQCFGGQNDRPLAVVDYAHTPNALEQALKALREHTKGKLCCVFGCGGDRDPGKRPLMGACVERWADELIVTNDNPRNEDPAHIAEQILAGMKEPKRAKVELDREKAIIQALRHADANDVILVAGKGHEDYQILGDRRIPFSDQRIIQQYLGTPD